MGRVPQSVLLGHFVAVVQAVQLKSLASQLGSGGAELDYLVKLAGQGDPELDREFRRLSGRGRSRGWKFDRDEIHERS